MFQFLLNKIFSFGELAVLVETRITNSLSYYSKERERTKCTLLVETNYS